MRDSQRQKVYATERAALPEMSEDYFAPIPRRAGGAYFPSEAAWQDWRRGALRALRTEAGRLTRTEWWQEVAGLDRPGCPTARATRLRIAPRNAQASRGGRYRNAYGVNMLATMLQHRTLVHELAHVAYYAMTRDTIDAYWPDDAPRCTYSVMSTHTGDAPGAVVGDHSTDMVWLAQRISRPKPADPGHGPIWRGLYVEALRAYGRPQEADTLRDAFEAARLAVTACPIEATPPALTVEPSRFALAAEPRRIEPAAVVEPLTLF